MGPLDHWDQGQDGIGMVLSVCERCCDESGHGDPVLMRERFRFRDQVGRQCDSQWAAINAKVCGLPVTLTR